MKKKSVFDKSFKAMTNRELKMSNLTFSDKVINFLIGKIATRLSLANQKSKQSNVVLSFKILTTVAISSLVFLLHSLLLMHSMWYHFVVDILVTIIFAYLLYDNILDHFENKIQKLIPSSLEILADCYMASGEQDTSGIGNVVETLDKAEHRVEDDFKIYIIKLRNALNSVDDIKEIEKLKTKTSFKKFSMVYDILLQAKLSTKKETFNSFNDLISLFGTEDIEKQKDGVKFKGFKLFQIIFPFILIYGTRYFSNAMDIVGDFSSIYKTASAQSDLAKILLVSFAIALFSNLLTKREK